jgi:hypothetical protein
MTLLEWLGAKGVPSLGLFVNVQVNTAANITWRHGGLTADAGGSRDTALTKRVVGQPLTPQCGIACHLRQQVALAAASLVGASLRRFQLG